VVLDRSAVSSVDEDIEAETAAAHSGGTALDSVPAEPEPHQPSLIPNGIASCAWALRPPCLESKDPGARQTPTDGTTSKKKTP
jgi:hypothetical protein